MTGNEVRRSWHWLSCPACGWRGQTDRRLRKCPSCAGTPLRSEGMAKLTFEVDVEIECEVEEDKDEVCR